jgi:hypothetical protein
MGRLSNRSFVPLACVLSVSVGGEGRELKLEPYDPFQGTLPFSLAVKAGNAVHVLHGRLSLPGVGSGSLCLEQEILLQ